ncbi:MAG: NAD(P)-dependent oxidoreductase [Armatimonadetes bacterium]|nr:NAD(P)-dependent oxidoreductase [Armatimonadota bacterium]
MRLLVTGAAGTLGSAIVELARGRHQTVAFDVVTPPAGDRIVTASVTDRDAVFDAAAGCDAILHTAGLHGAHAQTHSQADYLTVNVIGVDHLYQAMVHHGIPRMVQSSTMEVVCGRDWMANGAAILDERTCPRPDWIYPLTKHLAEQLAPFYYARNGLTSAMLRYMTMDRRPWQQLGLELCARTVWRFDAAEANLLAAESQHLGVEVLHIGPDTPLTNQDICQSRSSVEAVLERHWPGSTAVLARHDVKLRDCLWPVAPIDKAKRLLGWQPEATFAGYLAALEAGES